MESIFNPYREWLGWEQSRCPDYYELLAIERQERDAARIALAAEQAMRKVRSFRPGPQAQVWSRLLDEIRAARDCLSNPARRADYDALLARTDRFRSAAGDLHSPASAASLPPLTGAAGPAPIYDARRAVVSVPTPSIRASSKSGDFEWSPVPGAIDDLLPPGAAPSVAAEMHAVLAPAQHSAGVGVDTVPSAQGYATSRQRKARHGLTIGIIGGIAAGMIGAMLLLLDAPRDTDRGNEAVIGEAETEPVVVSDSDASARRNEAADSVTGANVAVEPAATVRVQPPAASAEAAAEPPPAPAESSQDRRMRAQALVRALETAKAALGEQNFALADEQLVQAASLARSEKHREAISRLTEVAGYARQFHEALSSAVTAMQAGDTVQVGSSEAAFVEGFRDKVTLRVSGTNRTYAFGDLPPGLALAIADRKLPARNPASAIVKGAYLAAYKQGDSRTRERAVELWREAEAGGAATAHLMAFFADDYADFLKEVVE